MDLRIIDLADFNPVFERITKDFPRNERPGRGTFRKRLYAGKWECVGLFEGETLMAYAVLSVNLPSGYSFLLYLAVDAAGRGKGTGTQMLEKLKERYGDTKGLIIEVEDPAAAKTEDDREIRERRIRFYERAGYVRLPVKYWLVGQPMHLMYCGEQPPEKIQKVVWEAYNVPEKAPLRRRFFCVEETE